MDRNENVGLHFPTGLQPIIAGGRSRIWVGAIFMVPSEQTLERQMLARVTFAPELGFIDSG